MTAREAITTTGPEMVACFAQIEARYPLARSTLIADNATCNRAVMREWPARDGCRVRVVSLPPCAPDLNRIERLWWFCKKKTLCNTLDPTLAEFRAAIRAFFAKIGHWQDEPASLLTSRLHLIGHKTAQISAAQRVTGHPGLFVAAHYALV